MAKKTDMGIDQYLQFYKTQLLEGSADVGVLQEINTSITAKDKIGMEIYEIEFDADEDDWNLCYSAGNSGIAVGLTTLYRGGVVPRNADQDGVIFHEKRVRTDFGTAGNGIISESIHREFNVPLLVHPAAVWIFIKGLATGAPNRINCKIGYKYVTLTDKMYEELFQTTLLQNIV